MTATNETLHKLQLRLQNMCCRILLMADRMTSIAEMHKELEIMKLDTRQEIQLAELCHKISIVTV